VLLERDIPETTHLKLALRNAAIAATVGRTAPVIVVTLATEYLYRCGGD